MAAQLIDARIFSADYTRGTADAWNSLVRDGTCPPGVVRNSIKKSWLRCLNGGVSPTLLGAPPGLCSEAELRRLSGRHHDFLLAAREALSPIYDAMRRSRSLFIVADPAGVVLDCCGEDEAIADAEQFHIRRGSVWAERTSGTNAIGTALILDRPIQVNATEHFCEGVKRWSCSAALVRDRLDGTVIGAIDITGQVSDFHLHSLALVISMANHVETILARQAADRRSALLQWSQRHVDPRSLEDLIVLDRLGHLVSKGRNLESRQPERRAQINRRVAEARAWLAEAEGGAQAAALDEQWFRPVSLGGETLGAAIVLPAKTVPRLSAAGVTDIGESRPPSAGFDRIIRKSEAMESLVRRADKLANSRATLLLLGETGAGKEELARAIHDSSPCSAGPYVAVNCGALAKELIASELFGHVEGAYTGARRGGAAGTFELADGGSLLLDEIGELPGDAQAHLLRVLQDGYVTRLGAGTGKRVNVRVLAATNRDLLEDCRSGRFRSDLYYRISVASLRLPALRERPDDILPLAVHFLQQFGQLYGRPPGVLSEDAAEALQAHPWPGNVRELRNVLERAFLLADGRRLDAAELRGAIDDGAEAAPIYAPAARAASLREIEAASIRSAIAQNGGNMLRAAKSLGISRSTLYKKIGKYGIKRS